MTYISGLYRSVLFSDSLFHHDEPIVPELNCYGELVAHAPPEETTLTPLDEFDDYDYTT